LASKLLIAFSTLSWISAQNSGGVVLTTQACIATQSHAYLYKKIMTKASHFHGFAQN